MRVYLLIALLAILSASNAQAVRFIVQNPCDNKAWLDVYTEALVGSSVGELTVATLTSYFQPYVGNEQGIHSIRGTVFGDQALELISDSEMRAYGWCFFINGYMPNEMPHKVLIKSNSDAVHWVFSFAHYLNGEWISYCTPTHLTRPEFICKANRSE